MLYDAKAAYVFFGKTIGLNTVRNLMITQEIVSFKQGKKYVTTAAELNKYVASKMARAYQIHDKLKKI